MYLISSCLVGVKCRYDGNNVPNEELEELFRSGRVLPVCPELLGGLGCPRECAEMIKTENGERKVITKTSKDVTDAFKKGAQLTLHLCKSLGITTAILKSQSPSCGYGKIYDGTFTGNLILGNGITAELLEGQDIQIFNEHNWKENI